MADSADGEAALIEVEVAYAKPEEQVVMSLQVPLGSTLQQAVIASGLLERFPEINPAELKVGVFGTLGNLDQRLKPGDRVEIYRSLQYDPKEARRNRALTQRSRPCT